MISITFCLFPSWDDDPTRRADVGSFLHSIAEVSGRTPRSGRTARGPLCHAHVAGSRRPDAAGQDDGLLHDGLGRDPVGFCRVGSTRHCGGVRRVQSAAEHEARRSDVSLRVRAHRVLLGGIRRRDDRHRRHLDSGGGDRKMAGGSAAGTSGLGHVASSRGRYAQRLAGMVPAARGQAQPLADSRSRRQARAHRLLHQLRSGRGPRSGHADRMEAV